MIEKYKGLSKSSKKSKFTEPMITNDSNWSTEKRLAWVERSKQSNKAIDAKHTVKPFKKPQDSFCVGKWLHVS